MPASYIISSHAKNAFALTARLMVDFRLMLHCQNAAMPTVAKSTNDAMPAVMELTDYGVSADK